MWLSTWIVKRMGLNTKSYWIISIKILIYSCYSYFRQYKFLINQIQPQVKIVCLKTVFKLTTFWLFRRWLCKFLVWAWGDEFSTRFPKVSGRDERDLDCWPVRVLERHDRGRYGVASVPGQLLSELWARGGRRRLQNAPKTAVRRLGHALWLGTLHAQSVPLRRPPLPLCNR